MAAAADELLTLLMSAQQVPRDAYVDTISALRVNLPR